jgi:hypothetical protein
MVLDDTTSTQLLLLDAEREFQTTPPNNIAHAARILARAGTTCSVALLLLFVTVACEFFTEDSANDTVPEIALKRNVDEPVLATQLAVSTALAVYVIITLMLIGSNQQVNGIFMRLQYMTQEVPLAPEQAASYATRADDFALFVRALLGLYVVICGSTGTFHNILLLDNAADLKTAIGGNASTFGNASAFADDEDLKPAIGGSKRNYVALVFICLCFVTDALRAFLPTSQWLICILIVILDFGQCFLNGVLAEVLFKDSSLTNFACAVLALCDGMCTLYSCIQRVLDAVRKSMAHEPTQDATTDTSGTSTASQLTIAEQVPVLLKQPSFADNTQNIKAHLLKSFSTGKGFGSSSSESHFNVDNIKIRVFEKKSN